MVMMNRLYCPGSDSTSIFPRCFCSMMDLVIDRPRPVPSPTGLVVKKGVNRCLRMSLGMPVPLSSMTSRALSPSRRREIRMVGV